MVEGGETRLSPVWKVHATFRRATLARSIWPSGEKRVAPGSPP
jgi:hypothetical protein